MKRGAYLAAAGLAGLVWAGTAPRAQQPVPPPGVGPVPRPVGAFVDQLSTTVARSQTVYDTTNTSTALLPANGSWTGEWVDVFGFGMIQALADADVPGTMFLDFSDDRQTVRRTTPSPVPGTPTPNAVALQIGPRLQWYRPRYANGPAPQTRFWFKTVLSPQPLEAGAGEVRNGMGPSSVGPVVRAATFALNADGSRPDWLNLDGSGNLRVSMQGVSAVKGDTGATGPAGPAGPAGPQGVQGPAGFGTVTPATPTRAIGTAFQPSATKAVLCVYTVKTSVTNPLLAGTSTASLALLSDGAATPTTARGTVGAGSSVGLAVTVALTTDNTAQLVYLVPPGHYVRLVQTVAGTGTVTLVSQTELTLG